MNQKCGSNYIYQACSKKCKSSPAGGGPGRSQNRVKKLYGILKKNLAYGADPNRQGDPLPPGGRSSILKRSLPPSIGAEECRPSAMIISKWWGGVWAWEVHPDIREYGPCWGRWVHGLYVVILPMDFPPPTTKRKIRVICHKPPGVYK